MTTLEVNGRSTSVGVLSGAVTAQTIEAYRNLSGGATSITPGAPMALGANGRWRLVHAGSDCGAPLVFT